MSRRGTKKQTFIGIIADEVCTQFLLCLTKQDTVTGFLLAGIGESDVQNGENWLVVTNSMSTFVSWYLLRLRNASTKD